MKKIILLLTLLTTYASQAGILLEPIVGYIVSGNVKDSETGATKEDYDYTSLNYGARVGLQVAGVMVGAEYNQATPSWDDQINTTAVDTDFKESNLGAFVGYNFPAILRVWGTFYFDSTSEVDSGITKGAKFKGAGQGIGIGFTSLPLISLNVEYRMLTYDEYISAAGVTVNLNSQQEYTAKEIVLSVSIPFELP